MKKSIGYVRISTKDQSNFSISGQEKYVRDYATRHDIEVLEIFTDDGRSAKNFDRPDWRNLESFISKHFRDIDYLIVAKYDRFSRNAAEGLQKIELLERKFNIIIASVFEEMYIDYDSPFFFKQRADMLVNAEFELHVIRDRTKFGNHQALSSGRYICVAPFGYQNARDEKNKPVIEVIPGEAEIVKLIYSLYFSGVSLKDIYIQAKRAGFKMSGHSAIKRILGNCTYAGLVFVPAYRKEAARHVKGIHEPIIEEHQWWEVQRRLGNAPRPRTVSNEEVPMRGELKCFCHKPFTAGNSRGKSGRYYWYYKCSDHPKKNYSATKLHEQFDAVLNHLSLSELYINYLKEKSRELMAVMLSNKQSEAARLKSELLNTQKKLESAEEKFIAGDLAADSYRKWYSRYSADISSLRHQLSEAESITEGKWELLRKNIHKLGNIKSLYNMATLMQKQMFLRAVFNSELHYSEGIYRTPFLHPLLSHNTLILKEKRLLIVEQSLEFHAEKEVSTRDGS